MNSMQIKSSLRCSADPNLMSQHTTEINRNYLCANSCQIFEAVKKKKTEYQKLRHNNKR
jgi:hypothetical protein